MKLDLIHGGALDRMRDAFPDAPEPWVDLSTGINPWPYAETTISKSALAQLPTSEAYAACRGAMAASMGAHPQALVLTPGSELLIRLLPDLIKPRRVAILDPTYGDHAEVWSKAGAEVVQTPDPLSAAPSVDAVVVTNPNNPDGRRFDPSALEHARETLAVRGCWLIIDEAYADLVPELSMAPSGGREGLIILRSFGKFFGLAGLRLGGLLAPKALRDALLRRLGHWPVSAAAMEIGARAYLDLEWQSETRERLMVASARLNELLKTSGLQHVGGTHLYSLVETSNAYRLFEALAGLGIYVRRFGWSRSHLRFGLPQTALEEKRLRDALILSA